MMAGDWEFRTARWPGPAEQFDVVVVGARAAGAATALLLARAGLRVAVLDRERYGSDTLSTHALMRTGVIQLHRWGVLDDVARAGTPPVRRTVFHYADGETTRITIKPAGGVDALYAPRRTVLDAALVDAAAAAGADVRFGARVTGLLMDGDTTVGVVGSDGRRTHRIRAALTVGADGLRSTVAQRAGAKVLRQGRFGGSVLYAYVPQLATDGYEWFYGDGGSAGFIPTGDGLTCVFGGAPGGGLRQLDGNPAQRLATLVERASPEAADRLRAAGTVRHVRGFGGHPALVRQAHGRGWALVGDAGYFKDPIGSHGISQALRDAELLAREVVATGASPDTRLDRYQTTRDRLSAELFAATDQVAGYRLRPDALRRELLRLSSAMSQEVEALLELDGTDGGGQHVPARHGASLE